MMYLIDTHVLLWYMSGDRKLSKLYIDQVEDDKNVTYVSKASLWENELDFNYSDLEKIPELPFHHYDPFDRPIISRAITRGITVISDDVMFQHYPVQLLKEK